MKKRLVCFGLALAFSLSSFSAISFAEGSWKKGWTGKADAAAYTVNANGSTVTMSMIMLIMVNLQTAKIVLFTMLMN